MLSEYRQHYLKMRYIYLRLISFLFFGMTGLGGIAESHISGLNNWGYSLQRVSMFICL